VVKKILNTFVEPTAFIVLFFVVVNRIIIGGGWINIADSTIEKVSLECILWILDAALFIWIASKKENSSEYFHSWKNNWILFVFVLFGAASIFWSEFFVVSFYKIYVLISCTSIAAYVAITYPLDVFFRKLTWFFGIALILSFALVFLFPSVGIHLTDENAGAWRGIFFQKNTLGIMMALSSIVFLYNLFSKTKNKLALLGSIFLYVISAVFVFLSRSASGIAIFLVLNFCSILAIAWVKWKERLSLKYYLAIGFVFTSAGILVLSKLDYLLGLLHRNSSLTGRVPLWSILIKIGQSNHPIIGGGFSYPWMNGKLRLAIQAMSGWGFAPVTAHDGFVDIYLHLGLVGIILLSALLLTGFYRSIRFLLAEQTLQSTFPLILMIFIIFANISESLFLELDSFVWLLLVFVLFASHRKILDPV